jgi:hypothetical protein
MRVVGAVIGRRIRGLALASAASAILLTGATLALAPPASAQTQSGDITLGPPASGCEYVQNEAVVSTQGSVTITGPCVVIGPEASIAAATEITIDSAGAVTISGSSQVSAGDGVSISSGTLSISGDSPVVAQSGDVDLSSDGALTIGTQGVSDSSDVTAKGGQCRHLVGRLHHHLGRRLALRRRQRIGLRKPAPALRQLR